MVKVCARAPTVAEAGERLVIVGTGLFTVKFTEFEVPPPGEGLTTVTETVPAVAMSPADIAAVNCVPLTNVLARALPFHCTVEPETKFVPLTVSVNADPPAMALEGEAEAKVGPGFTVKLNVLLAEVTPLPLAVMVIVWPLTRVALLAALQRDAPRVPRARLDVSRRHPTGQGAGREGDAPRVVRVGQIHRLRLRASP